MIALLAGMDMRNAWRLSPVDPWMLRKHFSVVIEKTSREIAGTSCLELDELDAPMQEICCSRMFGQRLQTLPSIKEAFAIHIMSVPENLRAQQRLCKRVQMRT